MNRDSGLSQTAARVLLAAATAIALATTAAIPAQQSPGTADRAATAPSSVDPRSGRDARRNAGAQQPEAAPADAAASAAEAPATATAAQAGETVEARIICKNRKLTGTKISRRICGTPEQWAAQEKRTTDDAQEAMRQVRDRSSIVVSQPDSPLGPPGN